MFGCFFLFFGPLVLCGNSFGFSLHEAMAWSWWDAPMASSTASSGLMQAVFSTGAGDFTFNLSPKNKLRRCFHDSCDVFQHDISWCVTGLHTRSY